MLGCGWDISLPVLRRKATNKLRDVLFLQFSFKGLGRILYGYTQPPNLKERTDIIDLSGNLLV